MILRNWADPVIKSNSPCDFCWSKDVHTRLSSNSERFWGCLDQILLRIWAAEPGILQAYGDTQTRFLFEYPIRKYTDKLIIKNWVKKKILASNSPTRLVQIPGYAQLIPLPKRNSATDSRQGLSSKLLRPDSPEGLSKLRQICVAGARNTSPIKYLLWVFLKSTFHGP